MLIDMFLSNVLENMKKQNFSPEKIDDTLTKIKTKYTDSLIFTPLHILSSSDYEEDVEEETEAQIEDKNASITNQMKDDDNSSSVLSLDMTKDEQIIALQEFYEDKNVFSKDELEAKTEVDEKGKFGRTKLHEAVMNEKIEEIRELLESGADSSIKDNSGFTPYFLAMLESKEEALKCFEELGIKE
jgi:ankyrin repeat protein